MAEWWDSRNTRWETLFDEAVTLASRRRLSSSLSMIKRIRSWQHRQSFENHSWHNAELLWLQGLVLERARQRTKARSVGNVWQNSLRLRRGSGASRGSFRAALDVRHAR